MFVIMGNHESTVKNKCNNIIYNNDACFQKVPNPIVNQKLSFTAHNIFHKKA